MPRKKKEDLINQTGDSFQEEELVILDESGNYLSEEEARIEEERLEKEMKLYFQNNPYQSSDFSIEEDEELESIVSLSNEGQVLAEKEIQTIEKETEVLVPAGSSSSFLESIFLQQIIQKRLEVMNKASEEIEKVSDSFYKLENGHSLYDNFLDSYRKERNRLNSYLFMGEELSIEAIKEEETKRILKSELKQAVKNLFELKDIFQEDVS